MSAPVFKELSEAQLREQLTSVKNEMAPYTVDVLRRLKDAGAINFEEERLLNRYESLNWLIEG
ncbi:hypothetical protein KBP53_04525 [Corynebacterium genitalium ATCC 33030]|uniref:hypothetical protein n=1 Tax=Corynebacterium TaxID=1716 RepID=UPI000303513D|nr:MULTISPECIES: hypothetical protein [Corynebacterium]MCQ4619411.1 hypothetical protein [Corynebacterium pseudogenitalium]MCQ4619657.1 hypothetical protein [Corynebacterium sp. CCUG 71335]MCQ4621862.1 hypothetical protein [Corynebacterium sp. CCUG 70398]MCQ4625181.1 hypothetical protein [Corynebacterium sp. CCUG 69979]MCQ4627652.1 hypothetical protein [Corynebacterium sp. CCUG 65737]